MPHPNFTGHTTIEEMGTMVQVIDEIALTVKNSFQCSYLTQLLWQGNPQYKIEKAHLVPNYWAIARLIQN